MKTMSYDMNDAEPQKTGELIADGSFAKVTMIIRPGGIDGQAEIDQCLLKAPKDPTSDVRMLDCEFTVAEGPFARRKFWQLFTVQGGKVDENGVSIAWKISKSTFRAMIDSALGLDPQDTSEAAKQKRILRGLADLNHIAFIAKIKIEASEDARYGDQPPRSGGAADREGMEARHGRQGCAGEPQPLARGRRQDRFRPTGLVADDAASGTTAATANPAGCRRNRLVAAANRHVRTCRQAAWSRLAQRLSHDRRRVADACHA
jgi:hypothetical protein